MLNRLLLVLKLQPLLRPPRSALLLLARRLPLLLKLQRLIAQALLLLLQVQQKALKLLLRHPKLP